MKFDSSQINLMNLVELLYLIFSKINWSNELTPINPLKLRFTVLPKLLKMALYTNFSDMKKNFRKLSRFLIISDWNVSVSFGTLCTYTVNRTPLVILCQNWRRYCSVGSGDGSCLTRGRWPRTRKEISGATGVTTATGKNSTGKNSTATGKNSPSTTTRWSYIIVIVQWLIVKSL